MSDIVKSLPADEESRAEGTEAFEEELDEFDLLESSPSDQEQGVESVFAETDLSATTRAFNTRIQRKKKEQEEAYGQAEKAARVRHALMLKALMNVRKSLREVTRIDLGERFEFSLASDDWQGWPRLAIRLIDADRPEEEYLQFVVTAHDRQAAGTLEISYSDSVRPEKISLIRDGDLKRLPNQLRKCVRTYLDLVGDIVLEAQRDPDEAAEEEYLEKKDISEFENQNQPGPAVGLTGDLFEDDIETSDFLEKLPSLDDLEVLPDLLSPKEKRKAE